MNYRYATVLAEKSLSTAGTETIDLNIQDPISRLEIGWRPTLGDPAMLAALAVGISKIELVDGSDVLHSLNGRENQALCIYDRRVPTMNHGNLIMNSGSYATFGIDFGRYLWDPELAFDPTRFRNPQLKITHDSTLLSANTDTHLLEVLAQCFDEKVISPMGFLMTKEHKSYSLGDAAAYEYTDMPTDHPIRQMIIRAALTKTDPIATIDTLKLSEDNDKRIPIDCELTAYMRRMKGQWLQVHDLFQKYFAAGDTYEFFVTPTDGMIAVSGFGQSPDVVSYLSGGVGGGHIPSRSLPLGMVFGSAIGYLPHHCIQFPFGRQDVIDDWYDVTKVGSLGLRILSKAAGDGGTVGVVLQQLRRY